MDSLTQLVLGSTVAHAIGAKKLGRKALVWGAIIGTLPDLDVIVSPLLNDVEKIIHHRGLTHAFFWQALIAPVIAFIIALIHRQFNHYWRWLFIVLLGFSTHSLIDYFTTYGTKIFLPFDSEPYALNILFIVDPLFSLPLIIAVLVGFFKPNKKTIAVISLVLSSSYALAAYAVQQQVLKQVKVTLTQKNIQHNKLLITPMPFSILWWRVVAINDTYWYEGVKVLWNNQDYTLAFDKAINFQRHSRNTHLLPLLKESWSLEHLNTFSKGFYQLRQSTSIDNSPQIVFDNLRMGFNQQFIFSYLLAEKWNGQWALVEPALKQKTRYDTKAIQELLHQSK